MSAIALRQHTNNLLTKVLLFCQTQRIWNVVDCALPHYLRYKLLEDR